MKTFWLSVSHLITHTIFFFFNFLSFFLKTCKGPWTWTFLAGTMDLPQTESLHHFVCLCWYYFLGPYLHWPLLNDYSAGLCFSRANADLRYIQSEMPLTEQPQSLFDFGLLSTLRGLCMSLRRLLMCGVPLQGRMLRAKAGEISQ